MTSTGGMGDNVSDEETSDGDEEDKNGTRDDEAGESGTQDNEDKDRDEGEGDNETVGEDDRAWGMREDERSNGWRVWGGKHGEKQVTGDEVEDVGLMSLESRRGGRLTSVACRDLIAAEDSETLASGSGINIDDEGAGSSMANRSARSGKSSGSGWVSVLVSGNS